MRDRVYFVEKPQGRPLNASLVNSVRNKSVTASSCFGLTDWKICQTDNELCQKVNFADKISEIIENKSFVWPLLVQSGWLQNQSRIQNFKKGSSVGPWFSKNGVHITKYRFDDICQLQSI